ncbi:MAG: response regulator [Lachnospirales bacterium]
MYKVLIVDDELLIRVGVQSFIDWESSGYEVVALAENGVDALEKFKIEPVDVIITDIMMPEMDGLELIKNIKAIDNDVKFIFLTCYNEFDLVREALQLGANDYILKLSMSKDDLQKVLLKIKKELDSGCKKMRSPKSFVDMEDLLQKFITTTITYEQLIKTCGISAFKEPFFAMYISIDYYNDYRKNGGIEADNLLKFSIRNIIGEISREIRSVIVDMTHGNIIYFAYNSDCDNWHDFAEKVQNALKMYLNLNCSLVICDPFSSLIDLPEIVRDLEMYLNYKFYGEKGEILSLQEYNLRDELVEITHDVKCEMLCAIKSADYLMFEGLFCKCFDEMTMGKRYLPANVKFFATELIYSFTEVAKENKIEVEKIFNIQKKPCNEISKYEYLVDVKEAVLEFVKLLISELVSSRGSNERIEILKAKDYINSNLDREIKLDEVANFCCISRTYFSALFKKETGERFSDYVNRLKMEKATDLIKNYGMKVSEASAQVGIYDLSYFSKIFKKYVGVSPSKIK